MSCLLIAHSESSEVRSTILPTTILLHYNYEFTSMANLKDKLLQLTSQSLVRYFGLCVQHKSSNLLTLSGVEKSTISGNSSRNGTSAAASFFRSIINDRMPSAGGFVDFFVSQLPRDTAEIVQNLQVLTRKKITVRFTHHYLSDNISPQNKEVVELYFNYNKLMWTRNESAPFKLSRLPSATNAYDRIRVVGKGSFGLAILYRRKDDDSLVILKEINILDLTSQERQLALNEVSLLSHLDHPHIISYYDSFEEDGVLMIEMEYAEGGTLAQLLARQEKLLKESEIMRLFEQMLSAVSYLHDNNVLHRDLKTANVFLTKDNDVKVGDFGISKIMGTETRAQGAQTVVGTPYYISPEMCEGKPYNEKSDIWALGCILYEMACLQKTFEGTNLPAVVNKIVKAQYDQIRGPYSYELKLLVRDMLKLDPDQRPTAQKALEIVRRNRSLKLKHAQTGTVHKDWYSNEGIWRKDSRTQSAVYEFDVANITLSPVAGLPSGIKIKQIAISDQHCLLLTSEKLIFAWGENKFGQLGLGDRDSRKEPTLVESLLGKSVTIVAAGGTFSIFCTERGTTMFCGNKKFCGDGERKEDCLKPLLIDALLREDIVDVGCGDEHAAALAEVGKVFVWGNGANGRLGTGDTNFAAVAVQIDIPTRQLVTNVRCGPDATVLLTNSGSIIAMGSNLYNKLNLNQREGFFSSMNTSTTPTANALKPTAVKGFPSRVVDVRLGVAHTGVLLESGHIYLFGRNDSGELGLGHTNAVTGANRPVKALLSKACLMLDCGDGFSLAGTVENELYFWGSRCQQPFSKLTIEDLEITGPEVDDVESPENKKNVKEEEERLILQPSIVLRLENNDNNNTFISLANLVSSKHNVMVVIETSIPNERKKILKINPSNAQLANAPGQTTEFEDSRVATWIQRELDDAEYLPQQTLNLSGADSGKQRRANQEFMSSAKPNEIQLLQEIENLKQQIKDQGRTWKKHESQMQELRDKLAELQALQQRQRYHEPPPEYSAPKTHLISKGSTAVVPMEPIHYILISTAVTVIIFALLCALALWLLKCWRSKSSYELAAAVIQNKQRPQPEFYV